MSWIDSALNILFPPPVSLQAFKALPRSVHHSYEPWILPTTAYKNQAKQIIKYIKETPDNNYIHNCALMIAETLEAWLIEHAQFLSESSSIILVPVPQHTATTKNRGFSQSLLLAKAIQKLTPYTSIELLLKKDKKTEKQALLPKNKRLINQIGAFSYTQSSLPTSSTIILVDDVSTTGSTLRECRKVLMKNGYKNIIAVVFAH